jgi:hypothetical protein
MFVVLPMSSRYLESVLMKREKRRGERTLPYMLQEWSKGMSDSYCWTHCWNQCLLRWSVSWDVGPHWWYRIAFTRSVLFFWRKPTCVCESMCVFFHHFSMFHVVYYSQTTAQESENSSISRSDRKHIPGYSSIPRSDKNTYLDILLFLVLTENTYPNELDMCNHIITVMFDSKGL